MRKKTIKAVVDRIEGATIILIPTTGQAIELKIGQFPLELTEGDAVLLHFQGDVIIRVEHDTQTRISLEKRIARKLAFIRKGKHLKE